MSKLKPCPFCGHKPMMETWSSGGKMYMLKCSNYNCIKGMDTYPRGHDLPKVIEEWNTRAEKEPAPKVIGTSSTK